MYGTSYDTEQNNKSLMCILDGRDFLYQWDMNVKITCENLQVGDEVHFCNACYPKALVVKTHKLGESVVADIPNVLLQKAAPIRAFRYVVDENSQYTIEEKVFSVIARPQPTDYVYEETEVRTIHTIVREAIGDYDKYLDKIIEIQDTINREFATVTDNRTSLGYWYQYLANTSNGFYLGWRQGSNGSIMMMQSKIEELEFPKGTQNVTDVIGFADVWFDFDAISSESILVPIKKFTGTLDIPNVTSCDYMFAWHFPWVDGAILEFNCTLEEVGVINTPNVKSFREMFYDCDSLITVRGLDLRSATSVENMFVGCQNLTNLKLSNIAIDLDLSYCYKLSLESLIGIIYELRKGEETKTLYLKHTTFSSLTDVWVRPIDITDEMRAEDDFIDEKVPFEVCEPIDEGAIPIMLYASERKNWECVF